MHKDEIDQVILGFDFGMKHIGIAIGHTLATSARPLTTIDAVDGIPNWNEIGAIINTWNIQVLVVGMPYKLDGGMQETTYAARKFFRRLQQHFKLPVHEVDERLTTKMAELELQQRATKKQHDTHSVAAALMTTTWIHNQKSQHHGEL